MELCRIGIVEALTQLHGMLDNEVRVELSDLGKFLGCVFEGRLDRVETLPSSDSAITASIEGGHGFFLDMNECLILLSNVDGEGIWLEFHCSTGKMIAVQAVHQIPRGMDDSATC